MKDQFTFDYYFGEYTTCDDTDIVLFHISKQDVLLGGEAAQVIGIRPRSEREETKNKQGRKKPSCAKSTPIK